MNAHRVLRRMDATGQRITFNSVGAAGVSRSGFTPSRTAREIQRLRQRHPATPPAQAPPHRQRASDISLLRRLEAATARIRQLEADDQQLRDALARALGERRAIEVLGQRNGHDTPNGELAENNQAVLNGIARRPVKDTSTSHRRRSKP